MRRVRAMATTAVLAVLASGCAAFQVVSVDDAATTGNAQSSFGFARNSVSADGRYVVFESGADNLVADDTNGVNDVFRRDLVAGTTTRVSVPPGGGEFTAASSHATITADGRHVAFLHGGGGVYVHDTLTGATTRQDLRWDGSTPVRAGESPEISGDGTHVVFASTDTLLLEPDPVTGPVLNGQSQVFRRNLSTGTLDLLSPGPLGTGGNSNSTWPSVDFDGSHVVFEGFATDLEGVGTDTNGVRDVFLWTGGAVTRISEGPGGTEGDGASSGATIDGDGTFVTYNTTATTIVAGLGGGGAQYPVLRELSTGTTTGIGPDPAATANSGFVVTPMSDDGRFVAFDTQAPLDPSDPPFGALYVWDRLVDEVQVASTDGTLAPFTGSLGEPRLSRDGGVVAFVQFVSQGQVMARTALVPEVDDIGPATISPGQTDTFTITGRFFTPGAAVLLNSLKLTVGATTVVSPTEIEVEITAEATMSAGPRDVSVSVPGKLDDAISRCPGCLTVEP